jgi:hypothetical protein
MERAHGGVISSRVMECMEIPPFARKTRSMGHLLRKANMDDLAKLNEEMNPTDSQVETPATESTKTDLSKQKEEARRAGQEIVDSMNAHLKANPNFEVTV